MDRFAFYYERYFFFMLYYLRDLYLVLNMFFLFTYFICIYWYFVFHEESWEIVNILKTSDKILPEWFFLSFFGFLKSVPDKFMGLFLLFVLLFALFLFVLNCILVFVYCRSSFMWWGLSFVLFYYLCMSGFFVIVCCVVFPIMDGDSVLGFVIVLFCCV